MKASPPDLEAGDIALTPLEGPPAYSSSLPPSSQHQQQQQHTFIIVAAGRAHHTTAEEFVDLAGKTTIEPRYIAFWYKSRYYKIRGPSTSSCWLVWLYHGKQERITKFLPHDAAAAVSARGERELLENAVGEVGEGVTFVLAKEEDLEKKTRFTLKKFWGLILLIVMAGLLAGFWEVMVKHA